MTSEELTKILNEHEKWLRKKGGQRANLCGADLRRTDLCGANLYRVDLRGADLYGANLCGADLCGADLRRTDLCDANLSGANLCEAELHGANLYRVDLRGADLRRTNLYGANLRGADLRGAIFFVPIACPTEGVFIGWKKVGDKIVKLEIPEDARRCSATTEKCRCDKAKVLAIQELGGINSSLTEIVNRNYAETTYKVGEMVYPDSFDDDRWNECTHGIHFFIDRESAVRW